jgi:hypothetical protein
MSTMKELRSLLNTATDQGWEVTRGKNNHIKCVSPNGNIVFVSSTPSDHRALENIKRDLRVNGLVIVRKNRRK